MSNRVVSPFSPFVDFGTHARWRVAKRPGLDAFLKEMAQLYEIVVFTDSMGGLADEVKERVSEWSGRGRGGRGR